MKNGGGGGGVRGGTGSRSCTACGPQWEALAFTLSELGALGDYFEHGKGQSMNSPMLWLQDGQYLEGTNENTQSLSKRRNSYLALSERSVPGLETLLGQVEVLKMSAERMNERRSPGGDILGFSDACRVGLHQFVCVVFSGL